MKKKLSYRAIISVICSAILFCMPVGAYLANGSNTMSVFASDDGGVSEDASSVSGNDSSAGKEDDPSNIDETGESTEGETDETAPEEPKEPECICEKHCSQYEVNRDCERCNDNYAKCAYVTPNVLISINTPVGWYRENAKVSIEVEDTLKTGNFVVAKLEAKIGQSGSWTDITEDRKIDISENCSIYVRVTDQKGNEYEKNRAIRCFDRAKPTLNAAVNDGLLSVQASDTDSGVKAIYVNGYEFKDITNGVLNIRLQQFDAGYQYFTIQAMDNAGNMSEVYKTQNPYYTDPEKEDSDNNSNPASSLPVNANATPPSSATAQVTEHSKTDSSGNVTQTTKPSNGSKKETEKEDEDSDETSQYGKEFYTIQTASEKVFYLIVDRDGEEEVVYFLTEISENDLLNTVNNPTTDTLPQNSAALDNGIPVDSALPNNNDTITDTTGADTTEETVDGTETTEEGEGDTEVAEKTEKTPIKDSTFGTYILFGAIGAVVIAAVYFIKIKKKKEDFLDEEDDVDEEEEFESDEDLDDEEEDNSDSEEEDE